MDRGRTAELPSRQRHRRAPHPACRALTPLFGSDAVVWTQDAAELDQEQSLDLMAWIARTLVEATIHEP